MRKKQEIGFAAGTAQDIDTIKHYLRGLDWKLAAVIAFFKINVPEDLLGEMLHPTESVLNKIISDARYGRPADKPAVVKRRKRWTKK